MPHLQEPIELRAQASRTRRALRLVLLVGVTTGLFVLGLSLLVLVTA